MTTRNDVKTGRLVYTCNCGWVDMGHASSISPRPNVGAVSLWKQIQGATGNKATREALPGFKVTYTQDMHGKIPLLGIGVSASETKSYFVSSTLSLCQKESVALAIFMEVSMGFEALQGRFPWSLKTGDSSFSGEDLVSNLIGFYLAVRPKLGSLQHFVEKLCGKVSVRAALAVWDAYGSVGKNKNHTFKPEFFQCKECTGAPKFPAALEQIQPAQKGQWFWDWNDSAVEPAG